MYTRRDFGKAAMAGLALSAASSSLLRASVKTDATVRGVKIGAITGAYGPFPTPNGENIIDVIIQKSKEAGVGHVELVNSTIEPSLGGPCAVRFGPGGPPPLPAGMVRVPDSGRAKGRANFEPPCGVGGQVPASYPRAVIDGYLEEREKVRKWRLNADLNLFRGVRKKFDDAGIELYSYVQTIGDDFTEAEMDAVFKQMSALGVDKFCTNQTRVSMGTHFAPFCEKYKIKAAFHTHDQVANPNEVSSPASLAAVLAMSKMFYINLDIGWYYRGGNDPFAYLKEHADRITHLHIRDSAEDGGNADIGAGVLKVGEILRYIRDKKLNIGCIIEQGGRTGAKDNLEAVKLNLDWMKKELSS